MAEPEPEPGAGAAKKAEKFLECGYRIDSMSPSLVAPTNDVFELKVAVDQPKLVSKFSQHTVVSEDSCDRSNKVSANFGIEGSYNAFSGAAETSLENYNASTTKTIRADQDRYFSKYVVQNNVLNYREILRDQVVQFCKTASPQKIASMLGHFYATEITLGGTMSLTRIITARKDDTASSLRASIMGGYDAALAGSAKAKASIGSTHETSETGRSETCEMFVTGGDTSHWLHYDGTSPESKAECQIAWAESMEDHALYPLKMRLRPLWEALEEHPDLVGKAEELKAYLVSTWKSDHDRIAMSSAERTVKDSQESQAQVLLPSIVQAGGCPIPCDVPLYFSSAKTGKFIHPLGGQPGTNVNLCFHDGGQGEPRISLIAEDAGDGRFYLKSGANESLYVHPQGGWANRDDVGLLFHPGGGEERLAFKAVSKGGAGAFALQNAETGRYVHPDGGQANRNNGKLVWWHGCEDEDRIWLRIWLPFDVR